MREYVVSPDKMPSPLAEGRELKFIVRQRQPRFGFVAPRGGA